MIADIPLHRLEWARRELRYLIDQANDEYEPHSQQVTDRDTLCDVLDDVVEAKRREVEAHRVTVATGGNREARL